MQSVVFVMDPAGDTFAALREARLGVPLWRGDATSEIPEHAALGVVAVPAARWHDVTAIGELLPTIVLAHEPTDGDALRALEAGAVGYLDAAMPASSLVRAIAAALQGESVYSRRVLATAIDGTRSSRLRAVSALTPRQREVLTLIAQGATDKEIAATLGITASTAQKHASNLVRRLGVPNRAAAVANASI